MNGKTAMFIHHHQRLGLPHPCSRPTLLPYRHRTIWDSGTWQPDDTYEIAYLRIITPDGMGDWSTPCTATTCAIDPADLEGQSWLQYRLDLATDNPLETPTVSAVSLHEGYATSGVYTSETTRFSETRALTTFTPQTTLPTGTAITYEYSLDNGTSWQTLPSDFTFPRNTTTRSFAWRATLTTTNPSATPTLTSATLTTTNPPRQTSTSLRTQVERITNTGNEAKATALEAKFNPDGSPRSTNTLTPPTPLTLPTFTRRLFVC
jgi:hypothetical protein